MLKSEVYYFTGLINGQPAFYYNSEGMWDTSATSTQKISEDEYLEGIYAINKHHQTLEFISFNRYQKELENYSEIKIRKTYEFFNNYPVYEEVIVDNSEYSTKIVLTANEVIYDLEIFKISYINYDDEGNRTIKRGDVVYSDDSLEDYEAIEIAFICGEGMPTLGLSYTNSVGNNVEQVFYENGLDGSISFSAY